MIDKYEEIFNRYKTYIEENSDFNAKVVKTYTSTSAYFPLITCVLKNTVDTDRVTLGREEYYDEQYYTIDIYTKDKIIDNAGTKETVASQRVNDELTKLTIQFFTELNMKRTACNITPNIDSSILRRTIQYQCMIGSARGNIIRR